MNINDCIKDILVSEEEIDSITSSLAEKITEDYKDSEKELILLCVLKGSIVFTSDLIKKIQIPLEVETMKVSSYADSTVSSGVIKIQLDLCRDDLSKVDILIVEDIVDSGNTLAKLTKHLLKKGASSVKTCTLLDKPSRRVVDFTPDYCGKVIPDEFVVGYGLDYNEKFRNLPFIGILKPEVYGASSAETV
jgi:hypoxanthine phosphoribosyltransferase